MTTSTAPSTTPARPAPDLLEAAPPRRREHRWRLWLRGPESDPAWARPALLGLLAATALLYLWGLGASGWANSFYSAAAQAGSASWKAWFFGSSDAGNSITVDKTPLSVWVMALSVRAFGLSSWSILVPQAVMGVGAVGLLHASVRRVAGHGAAMLAGAVLALTPVAVLMFRFNNPDALLVLLLVAAAYATLRAVEHASTRWIVLAGALVGLGSMTKMLQALLIVPALALGYLVAAPAPVRLRLWQLVLSGVALLVSGGWWIAVVQLWPASSRPYIGGSQTNSVLELVLGYNGLGRLTGNEAGSVGGGQGGGQGSGWGETGWTRMFGTDIGGQIAWLLPAALLLLVAGLWAVRRAPRTDRVRAALGVWGGWLLVTLLTFSFMAGIFHQYYTVALAPAVAALVGIGAVLLWRTRPEAWASTVLALTLAVTAGWSYVLLHRSSAFLPWLAAAVLVVGLAAALALLVLPLLPSRLVAAVVGAALLSGLAGPAAYALDTAATPKSGAIVLAGPAVTTSRAGVPGGLRGPAGLGGQGGPGGGPGQGTAAPNGAGSLLQGSTPSSEVVAALRQDAGSYTWSAAAIGSMNASGYQLASEEPVMAIGGFNGSDPSPSLEEFEAYVAAGQIHWFIGSGGADVGPGGGRSSGSAQEIAAWVQDNFSVQTVGGITMYDLTTGSAATATSA